jgi:hypothetical protein
MPNWCENVVMIKGTPGDILKVKELLKDDNSVYSFQNIIPCPPALLNTSAPNRNEQNAQFNLSKYGAKDWYDWCVENWGTKWGASSASMILDDTDQISYSFETAWTPPIPVHDKLAEMFPNTNIFVNYDESGCDFSGYRYYENGELSKKYEYNTSYYAVRTYMEPDSSIWEWLE